MTIRDKVKSLLNKYDKAKENDGYLLLQYLKDCGLEIVVKEGNPSIIKVLNSTKTVTRERRKLQAEDETLRPKKSISVGRIEQERIFRKKYKKRDAA